MEDKVTIKEVKEFYRVFTEERDWDKFHKPKDLLLALSTEVGELQEHFLWKSDEDIKEMMKDLNKRQKVTDEMADVFAYLVRLSDKLNIDLIKAFYDKMEHNKAKYPADKVKGSAKKYNEY
jgi:NTP pyrophosphatase (non-canonical NTP hydrolase)